MSVVRQRGGWRLEAETEGSYFVTHHGELRSRIVTAEYDSPDGSNEYDSPVPVRTVSSATEAEHVFTSMATGDAFVPVPASVTRSGETIPHDTLPDLPLGGVAFAGLLACSCFAALYATALPPLLFAVGVGLLLTGAVVAGIVYRECQQRGVSVAVERLLSVDAAEDPYVDELAE
jgi:hypothetical protein